MKAKYKPGQYIVNVQNKNDVGYIEGYDYLDGDKIKGVWYSIKWIGPGNEWYGSECDNTLSNYKLHKALTVLYAPV